MTTSTTTFSPKLIIGQQGSGKTYDLVQTAKEFFQQHSDGQAVIFSYDANEYAEVGTSLTEREEMLAHCGPSEAREFYERVQAVDDILSDRIVGSIYKAAPILILADELIGLGDRLNRGEADHLGKIFDRIAREGGKYGIYIVAATHTCKQAPHKIRLGDSFEWVETSKSIQAELQKRIEQEMEKAAANCDRKLAEAIKAKPHLSLLDNFWLWLNEKSLDECEKRGLIIRPDK